VKIFRPGCEQPHAGEPPFELVPGAITGDDEQPPEPSRQRGDRGVQDSQVTGSGVVTG
jgi:hypothetical protein